MRFDHLGIATNDADAAAETFGTLLGAPVAHEESSAEMRFVFLDLGNGYFELLEPVGDGSPIADYLEEDGPGIHHVAVHVEDIRETMAEAREAGFDLLGEEPRPGAWGHEIAFVDPASTAGVLVEFVS